MNKVKEGSSKLYEIQLETAPMTTTISCAGAFCSYSRTVLPEWRMDQSFNKTVNIAGVSAVRSRTGLPPAE